MAVVRGVVFDLFYTLVSPASLHPPGYTRRSWMAKALGADERVLDAFWRATYDIRESSLVGAMAHVREFAELHALGVPEETFAAMESDWDRYEREAILQPESHVLDGLTRLRERGMRLGLLSNTHALEVRAWPDSPLAPMFDATRFSHEIGVMKPDAKAYASILEGIGLDATSCAFVGDGASGELRGARDAGFGSVFCMRGFVGAANVATVVADADHVIDSIDQVAALL